MAAGSMQGLPEKMAQAVTHVRLAGDSIDDASNLLQGQHDGC